MRPGRVAVGCWIGGQLGEAGPVHVDHEDVLLLAVLGAPAEGDLAPVGGPGWRVILSRRHPSKAGSLVRGDPNEDPGTIRLGGAVEGEPGAVNRREDRVVGFRLDDRCYILAVGA